MKYEPHDEEAYRRIRLINMHYQVALDKLGATQLMMTEALTYPNMYRPNRSKVTSDSSKIDVEKVQCLIQNNTLVSSQSYLSMPNFKSFGQLQNEKSFTDAKTMESDDDMQK